LSNRRTCTAKEGQKRKGKNRLNTELRKRVIRILEDGLTARCPQARTIAHGVSIKKRLHVVIVSEAFKGLGELQKQELAWGLLDEQLSSEEREQISGIVTYSLDELH
jgi:stress-induced morphogen